MVSSNRYLTTIIIILYNFPDEVYTIDFGVVSVNEIKLISTETGTITIDVGLHNMNFAAYDPIKKDVYIGDSNEKKIFRIKTNEQTAYVAEPVVARENLFVNGMAFDHSTSTLYWTSDGGIFYVRVPDDIEEPLTGIVFLENRIKILHDIMIDVHGRFLYWASDGPQMSTIERLRLNWSKPQVVAQDLTDPQDIAVDVKNNTLYWTDEYENGDRRIHRMNLDDDDSMHALINGEEGRSPFVIALDDRNVYWIDKRESYDLWRVAKSLSHGDIWPTLVSAIQLKFRPIKLFLIPGDKKAVKKGDEIKKSVSGARAESKAFRFLNHYKTHTQHNHN